MKTSTLGSEIRRRREARSLSQADLARATRIDRGHISRLEAGVHVPTLPILGRIATALGTTPGRLLGAA
jgi:transcriptional regulator with XRE-family HTH domain